VVISLVILIIIIQKIEIALDIELGL